VVLHVYRHLRPPEALDIFRFFPFTEDTDSAGTTCDFFTTSLRTVGEGLLTFFVLSTNLFALAAMSLLPF
jgi:hypothetical protein